MHVQWLLSSWLWPLLLAVAVACVLWTRRAYRRSEPPPAVVPRRLLVGLRTTACALVLIAMARPLLVRQQALPEPAVVAVVVEDSGSMALRDRPDGPSRWTQSWRLAAAIDSLLSRQDDSVEVALLRGNGRLPLRQTTLRAALADTPRAVGTDLPALIEQARQGLLGRPLRGIVVLSDGHSQERSSQTPASGLPLWLVGLGEVTGPPDRFLADLRYPDRVQRGDQVTVEIAVGQHEVGGLALREPITVRLLHDGEVVDTQTRQAADLTRWELNWSPREVGLAVLEVEIAPLDNERFLANNRATFAVDVQKDQARILVLARVPGWDVRFLAQAARREPRLRLEVVRPGPTGPVLAADGGAWLPPDDAEAWRRDWDAVVLAGPPGALLPDAGVSLAAAARRGLGVLAIAGDPATDARPQAWPAGLLPVLPVALGGMAGGAGEWPVDVPPDAPRHPILAGIADGAAGGGVPATWPPLRRLHAARPQAAAQVLLRAGHETPLLVAGRPDDGRCLWFGGRRLWELAFWRLPATAAAEPAGSASGGSLLEQMLLWVALGDEASGISLLGQRLVFEEGEFLAVGARWLDLRGEPVTGRSLAVEVARPDGQQARIHTLQGDPQRPGVAVGELPPLPPGRWRLTPQSTEASPQTGPARDIVVTRGERELTQVRQDRRSLRQIAARLGGEALDAGRQEHVVRLLDELAGLDLGPRRSLRQSRHEPAAGWPWLAIAVGLLGAEWLLRRRYGLL